MSIEPPHEEERASQSAEKPPKEPLAAGLVRTSQPEATVAMNAALSHLESFAPISGLLSPGLRRAEKRVGTVIAGKYRLERVVGGGGMAYVYAAAHVRNGSRVAIKVLHEDLAGDEEVRSRFLREGYLANAVGHPGVVHVIDDDLTDEGSPFLVMEFLDGETLESRCARNGGRLEVAEVARVLSGVLEVLSAAHAKGIVHRDVKPENVFLTNCGQVKLLDFGIARETDPYWAKTIPGTVLGTPGFMSPEQALGRNAEVDALSDLYSVGATAFALLSGCLAHPGLTSSEVLARTALEPAIPLSTVAPFVPMAMAQVVDRALAFRRTERWPSASAMRESLVRAAADAARPPLPDAPAKPQDDRRPGAPTHRAPALAPRDRTPAGEGVMSKTEERRWRRELRGGRFRPLMVAVLGVGLWLTATGQSAEVMTRAWTQIDREARALGLFASAPGEDAETTGLVERVSAGSPRALRCDETNATTVERLSPRAE